MNLLIFYHMKLSSSSSTYKEHFQAPSAQAYSFERHTSHGSLKNEGITPYQNSQRSQNNPTEPSQKKPSIALNRPLVRSNTTQQNLNLRTIKSTHHANRSKPVQRAPIFKTPSKQAKCNNKNTTTAPSLPYTLRWPKIQPEPYSTSPSFAPVTDVESSGKLRYGSCNELISLGPKDGLYHWMKRAVNTVGLLLDQQNIPLATCNLIGPKIIITARHAVNGKTLDNIKIALGGSTSHLQILEDGADNKEDYIIFYAPSLDTESYSPLCLSQPPLEVFMLGYKATELSYIYSLASRGQAFMLSESLYCPTTSGFSGSAYQTRDGNIYGLHIKNVTRVYGQAKLKGCLLKSWLTNYLNLN